METENGSPASPPQENNPYILWVALAIAVAAVLLAALVISRVAAPLIGLIAPPEPPRFEPSVLVERRTPEEALDQWVYTTSASSCEVYRWYSDQADECQLTQDANCSDGQAFDEEGPERFVARCFGRERFGDFVADWEVSVYDGYTGGEGRTRFFTTRAIDWMTGR